MNNRVLILNDIRSVHNVGAIFRTADAIGIDKIYITGYTPAPFDRFGRKRNDISKAALGAEKTVDWEYEESVETLIASLKEKGYTLLALEQSKDSIDYKKFEVNTDVAILLGNEVYGVSKELLEEVDVVLEIPMMGKKESLNVSVATGILLYRLFDR